MEMMDGDAELDDGDGDAELDDGSDKDVSCDLDV